MSQPHVLPLRIPPTLRFCSAAGCRYTLPLRITFRKSSICFGWNWKILSKLSVPSSFRYGFFSTSSVIFFLGTELPLIVLYTQNLRKRWLFLFLFGFISIDYFCGEFWAVYDYNLHCLSLQLFHFHFRRCGFSQRTESQFLESLYCRHAFLGIFFVRVVWFVLRHFQQTHERLHVLGHSIGTYLVKSFSFCSSKLYGGNQRLYFFEPLSFGVFLLYTCTTTTPVFYNQCSNCQRVFSSLWQFI